MRVALDVKGRSPAQLVLLAALVVLAVQFAPTVQWLWQRWTTSVWQDAHGLLILPAVAWFAWQELTAFRGNPADPNPWGFLFVGVAVTLVAIDAGLQSMLLSAVGIVVLLPGLSLLLLGTARTKAIAFPLAFAAFMLPIPLRLTEHLHLQLRHIAAAGSERLLTALNIPNFLDGLTIHLPRGAMFVADSCSGFSTLYAAFAVACLTAHATRSTRRRILVLALAAPIAIASNILRVTLLGLLVQWYGTPILNTWWHPASGIMTFALSLPLIFWLGQDAPPPPLQPLTA